MCHICYQTHDYHFKVANVTSRQPACQPFNSGHIQEPYTSSPVADSRAPLQPTASHRQLASSNRTTTSVPNVEDAAPVASLALPGMGTLVVLYRVLVSDGSN